MYQELFAQLSFNSLFILGILLWAWDQRSVRLNN